MEKIIIYNVADARKIITMAANMRIKSIVIFCDVTQKHLDKLLFGIRNNNLNVDYKAVMTKTNKSWTLNKILYHMEIEKKNERR